jgi:hypothetical protein
MIQYMYSKVDENIINEEFKKNKEGNNKWKKCKATKGW